MSAIAGNPTRGLRLAALRWQESPFDALTPRALQAIHVARQQVFIVEQRCAYLDADTLDAVACHLVAWDGDALAAYARVLPPGAAHPEAAAIGRVLTALPWRGRGLGGVLVARAIALAAQRHAGAPLWLHAQSHLERFYGGFGFVACGARHVEDGIEHTPMWREARTD